MRIIALETTERIGSIALSEDNRLLATRSLDPDQRSAQSLAVGLRESLAQEGWQPEEVSLIAVASGPGSFTGLRVGVTTAKTFAYAVGAQVLGINTLDVIATGCPIPTGGSADAGPLWCIMDAQRRQVFAAKYDVQDGRIVPQVVTTTLEIEDWIANLAPGDRVAGPMLAKMAKRLPQHVTVLDPSTWAPRAEHVGRLAWDQYQAGRREDVWQLVPNYFRRSAAEEQHDASTKSDVKSLPR